MGERIDERELRRRAIVGVRDEVEECGRGEHVRFVVDVAKTRERLAKKRARAG